MTGSHAPKEASNFLEERPALENRIFFFLFFENHYCLLWIPISNPNQNPKAPTGFGSTTVKKQQNQEHLNSS
jgi:hypothetical protein